MVKEIYQKKEREQSPPLSKIIMRQRRSSRRRNYLDLKVQATHDKRIVAKNVKDYLFGPFIPVKHAESADIAGSSQSADQEHTPPCFINCDVRYFDFSCLGSNFDIVLLDPPWRLRGSDQIQSKQHAMFTNSKFSLTYNTLSDEEIMDLNIEVLSTSGMLFLWVINSQLQLGLKCLKKWGYQYVNRIIWIKQTKNGKIAKSQGYYLLHSSEICLVGVKGNESPFTNVINRVRRYQHYSQILKKLFLERKISNDVLFAEVREPSQKPDEIYDIIDNMTTGNSLKIEIFAKNHNLRCGWLSLGNQIGNSYDHTRDRIICNECRSEIPIGCFRYKSKYQRNLDLCEKCISDGQKDVFFCFDNIIEELVFHEYFECDICKIQPIAGIRFTCSVCQNFDVCENCYDSDLMLNEKNHKQIHPFLPVEIPLLAGGLPIHRVKCCGCNISPIIGYCFSCTICKNMNLCQKCLFLRKTPRGHIKEHNIEIFMNGDTNIGDPQAIKCDGCLKSPIQGARFKCDSCLNFDLCEICYREDAEIPNSCTTHKSSHSFTRIEPDNPYHFPNTETE